MLVEVDDGDAVPRHEEVGDGVEVVGKEGVVGSNAQGAVNSLTPPCTCAAVMARGFIWPLDSVLFHFVTLLLGLWLTAFLRPGLVTELVTSSRQEVEAQMGC